MASERHGVWGRAVAVPGRLATGGVAEVDSVSCASAGNCTAAGSYADRSDHGQGFVASERHGVWGTATEIPGLGALNTGGFVPYVWVSCSSAGNCAADGPYNDRSGDTQGFVASERNGTWGNAIEVPSLGALNTGGYADVLWISCAPDGTCAADGFYHDRSSRHGHSFVVSQRNHW